MLFATSMRADLTACHFAPRSALVVRRTRVDTRMFAVQCLLTRVLAVNLPEYRPLRDFAVHLLAIRTTRVTITTTARRHDSTTKGFAAILSSISRAHHMGSVLAIRKCFSHDFVAENFGQRIHRVAMIMRPSKYAFFLLPASIVRTTKQRPSGVHMGDPHQILEIDIHHKDRRMAYCMGVP